MARDKSPVVGKDGFGITAQSRGRVYVIDDDIDVRKSLHFLMAASAITAWPFAEATDFLDQLSGLEPAPILLDIRMPGINGLQMLTILKERGVRWPVIVMTAHGDVPIAVRAIKSGAIEFLEKPFKPGALDEALALAVAALDQETQSQRDRDEARRLIGLLSAREREIVTILTEGVTNRVAADRLGLSARTVEMHRGNAFAKLGLKSIVEVMALITTADLSP